MPYGKSIPIKNAGRVMEQFVQIVVPRGTQQAASSFMGGNAGALAGNKFEFTYINLILSYPNMEECVNWELGRAQGHLKGVGNNYKIQGTPREPE